MFHAGSLPAPDRQQEYRITFASLLRGLGAGIGGSLQLRLFLRSSILNSLIDEEEEIGVGAYESVGEVGTLIGEAAEGELADMATGEVVATFTSLL